MKYSFCETTCLALDALVKEPINIWMSLYNNLLNIGCPPEITC